MKKKKLIKNLLEVFENSEDKVSEGFKAFDQGAEKLKKQLKEKIQVATLDEVNDKIDKFRKAVDIDPLIQAIERIRQDGATRETELVSIIGERLEELRGELSETRGTSKDSTANLEIQIRELETKLSEVASRKVEFPDFATPLKEAEARLVESISKVDKKTDKSEVEQKITEAVKNFTDALEKLRREIFERISNIGGGQANRQVLFNSTDYLKRFTDYNLIAGNNVTFTISENNTAKRVNVTIASSGSGGGRVRLIQSVAINTVMGDDADTDYVYLVSGTTTMTLPTGVGNDNQYTVKNVGSGVVTIDTTGGETIDGNLTITMPVQFTSVDLISDTANWNIT